MRNKTKMTRRAGILLMFALLKLAIPAWAQEEAGQWRTIYLVRHAEKASGPDPVLAATGLKRAGELFRILRNKKVDKIYVTDFRRTNMTADSLRIYSGIDTIHYAADTTGNGLLEKLNSQPGPQKTLLIIGHSNTIPAIIRKLGYTGFTLKEIPDHEYDNLYILHRGKGKMKLEQKKFGLATPGNGTNVKMRTL